MKSFILHGENQPESRRKMSLLLQTARGQEWEIIRFDWNNNNIDESILLTASRTQSMLSFGHLIVVENFFNKNKEAIKIISKLPFDQNIAYIFWEGKKLSPTTIKKLQEKKFVVERFKVSAAIFNFLYSLAPKSASACLKLFRTAFARDSADFILIMFARHIRLLLWAKEDVGTLKLPEWQKRNLVKQAEKFSKEQLLFLHHELLILDRKNKHSQLPEDLSASLDLFIASL